MKKRFLHLFIFGLLFPFLQAQEVEETIKLLLEDYLSQNDEGAVDGELLYENLYNLYENPINLNAANSEDLSELLFLSPHQINALIDYRSKHGVFLSLYELQGIYGFEVTTVQQLLPFVCLIEQDDTRRRKLYLKSEVLTRTTTVLEDQLGYTRPDSLTHYTGGPYSALLKYKGSLGKSYSWHVTAEQDRGEPWFEHTKGPDFLSAGLQYEGDGVVRNVIVGDYRMCFGQGLAVNNNFGYGKSSQVLDVLQKGKTLRRFTSSSEFGIFRGVATNLRWHNIDFVVGVSSRHADASLDSMGGDVVIRSLPETGFHRTDSEADKFKAAQVNDVLAHISYTYHRLKIGASYVGEALDYTYMEEQRLDNLFTPSYKTYYNATIDYQWSLRGMTFFGEVATDKQQGLALIQGMSFYPSSRVGMSLLYRNFSKDYYALYGQAFAEGSHVNNEEGLYLGFNLLIANGWSLDTYFDYYHFPWLRYGVSRPTSGYDLLMQANYVPTRSTKMHWRLKYEEKEDNLSIDLPTNQIVNTQRLNWHYNFRTQINDYLWVQSRIAATQLLHGEKETGFLIYQDVTTRFFEQKLALTLRYALHSTPSYDSRVYAYESDVLYLSSTPAFYGKGTRTYLNASYALSEGITFYFKAAYSRRYDQDTMGSALDLIDTNHKTDIHLQLRIKL